MASRATVAPLRRAAQALRAPSGARFMSGGSVEHEIAEMNKWRSVTAVAVPGCLLMAGYMVATGEHHAHEKIPYPYLHIRNKQFPWGTDLGFFELPPKKHH